MSITDNPKVAVIVVTYNRKDLLMECLGAILDQSYPLEKIIVIDNASTDGTQDSLREAGILDNKSVDYRCMPTNTGGSGGFCEGLKVALESGCDLFWLMDDDTVPQSSALFELINAYNNMDDNVSFLVSSVFGPDGEYMNVPTITGTKGPNGYPDWYRRLDISAVKLRDATFVSILFDRKAVERCGLPCVDYFLWGDDSEYTMRAIKYFGPGYIIGRSVAIHKRPNAAVLSILKESDPSRVRLYRYFYRNILINKRLYGSGFEFCSFLAGSIRTAYRSLFSEHGLLKFVTVHKGILGYIFKFRHFKNYIDSQVSLN